MARALRKSPATALARTVARLENASLTEITGLTAEQLCGMYRRMGLIREFEERSAALYRSGRIRGFPSAGAVPKICTAISARAC